MFGGLAAGQSGFGLADRAELDAVGAAVRKLPIEARYVGRMVQTSANEIIEVKFQETDNLEKVLLVERIPV